MIHKRSCSGSVDRDGIALRAKRQALQQAVLQSSTWLSTLPCDFWFRRCSGHRLTSYQMRKRGPDPESESGLPSAPQPLLYGRYVEGGTCSMTTQLDQCHGQLTRKSSLAPSRPSVSGFSYLHQGVDISMLRQLVAGQGCTDDAGPSTSSNPLAGLFSHMLGTTKHNEYLHEVRTTIPTFSKIDQDKIRNRSHIHTRHLFPGATTTK